MTRLLLGLFVLCLGFHFSSCNISKRILPESTLLPTAFEKNQDYSASYDEVIAYYQKLTRYSSMIQVNPFGRTDSGKPLHEVIISGSGKFSPKEIRNEGKAVVFVNNGIHPGEPCGIDASMILARDLISGKQELLKETVLVIIPVYNIGGALNRGSYSRTNQNGPLEYGFRGNAKNLDLNRDFIKCDSDNAKSFNRLFNKWDPDIFIDNHTSNGADYQYVITLIATQKDKLAPVLSNYQQEKLLPELYRKMENKGYEMTPYVYARRGPENGIAGFMDLPRYSSGYAALHHTLSFMPETHMLKEFKDRVRSVYYFMESILEHLDVNKENVLNARTAAKENCKIQEEFGLNWELDFDKEDKLTFKGYESGYKKSKVTGQDRLYYDRSKPYTKEIPYYNSYKAIDIVKKPEAYIIPQAYSWIMDRMKDNNVEVSMLNSDTTINVEVYRIENFSSPDNPYEGHFIHRNVETSIEKEAIKFYKGDYLIYTNQTANRYIIETLEPTAPDSWFAWNFFDGILSRKEYFSAYVFEDLAEEILDKDPDLEKAFNKKREEDKEFRENAYAQLNYIYQRSPHFENSYKRYPVFRLVE